jgi:hypothetical protein
MNRRNLLTLLPFSLLGMGFKSESAQNVRFVTAQDHNMYRIVYTKNNHSVPADCGIYSAFGDSQRESLVKQYFKNLGQLIGDSSGYNLDVDTRLMPYWFKYKHLAGL